jgi:hypothetical protein
MKIVNEIQALDCSYTIITKDRFLFFFSRPHTSVIPLGLSRSGLALGFQLQYSTSEPDILDELHDWIVREIIDGEFERIRDQGRIGVIFLPPEKEYLRQYILGFR